MKKISLKELYNAASKMQWYDFENWVARELVGKQETEDTSEITNNLHLQLPKYEELEDSRDVEKSFKEWTENQEFLWWANIGGTEKIAVVRNMKQFATYFAQRCGVVFTESINHIHLKDGVDVYKALSDFVMEKNRTLPMHDADWLEFAQYFAKRCGVQLERSKDE